MKAPIPSLAALAVNAIVEPSSAVDVVPVFRSIEDVYNVDIKLSHTGITVRARRGMGEVKYCDGNHSDAKTASAVGAKQCADQRRYALGFLVWAREHMPTMELSKLMVAIGHEH